MRTIDPLRLAGASVVLSTIDVSCGGRVGAEHLSQLRGEPTRMSP